jgi:hypothetical protein
MNDQIDLDKIRGAAIQKERVRLFPSPVLTGSGSEGIISARSCERAPLKFWIKVGNKYSDRQK